MARRLLVVLFCVLICGWTPLPVQAEEKILVMAVEDCESSAVKITKYLSFGSYLVEQLPAFSKVAIKFPKNKEELDGWIKSGKVHLVVCKLHRLLGWQRTGMAVRPLASLYNQDGNSKFSGIFISRKDSNITSYADMKGQSILFGAKGDFEKNEAAIYTLMQQGIASKNYFKSTAHGSICPLIGKQISDGKYDIGLISDYSWGDILESRRVVLADMQIVARTIPIPYRILFGTNLSVEELEIIAAKSASLKDKDLLDKLRCSHLRRFASADLNFLHNIEKKIANWEN